jgi:hypothetical protein
MTIEDWGTFRNLTEMPNVMIDGEAVAFAPLQIIPPRIFLSSALLQGLQGRLYDQRDFRQNGVWLPTRPDQSLKLRATLYDLKSPPDAYWDLVVKQWVADADQRFVAAIKGAKRWWRGPSSTEIKAIELEAALHVNRMLEASKARLFPQMKQEFSPQTMSRPN